MVIDSFGLMRRIDSRNFKVATRGTSREINRRIALNLVRERQPISRADLARLMHKPRSAVGLSAPTSWSQTSSATSSRA